MKSQLKWLATATCAAAWSVCSYATVITVDNFTAVQSEKGNNGGNYAYFQFALNDSRMATSDGSTLADEVVVSKIAVGQRNPTTANTYSIDEGSWLLIQEVNSLGGSNLGGTLGVTVATTAPLTAEGKDEGVKVGDGDDKKTLTLCTWTLTTPVRLSKSKTYRATFYNASNAPANQQLEMVNVRNVTIGTSTKIHASGDPNYSPYVRVTVTDEVEPVTGVAKSATLTEDGTWSSLPWDPTDTPAIADTVTLSADAARTVTLTDDVTISGLTLSGTGPFSFAPASGQTPMLIAYATTANADTDVSAIAHLGAVTLASGKKLTVAPSAGYYSLTSGTASSGAADASKLVVNATSTPLSVTDTDSRSAALKSFTGVVEFKGSGSTGATVEFGYANATQAFKPRFIFNGGTHTMRYGCSAKDNLFSPGGTDENPTILVEEATHLTFVFKDLSGWNGSTAGSAGTPPPSVIRVGKNGRLTFDDNGSATGYFRDRILLDSGAEVTNSHNCNNNNVSSFNFYGGVGGVAQLAMKDDQGTATWNGGFNTDKSASKIEIGSNSTLCLNGAITGSQEITKAGDGTLTLTGESTNAALLTISAGTVKLQGDGVWKGSIANNGILEVFNATGGKTLSKNLSGTGTVKKSGAGTLSLTGTVSTPVKVELAGGTLDLGTNRPTLGAVAEDATLKLTVTTAEAAAGAVVVPTTLLDVDAPDLARFSVVNGSNAPQTVDRVTVANGLLTLALPVSEPTFTVTNDGDGTWTDCPSGGNVTIAANQLTKDKTVTIPAPAEGTRDLTRVTVVGNTMAKVTLVVESGVTIETLVPYGYVRVDVDTVNALTDAPEVSEGATLEVIVDDGTKELTTKELNKAISGAGKFAKGGSDTLTLGANITITTTGGSIVQEGTLKFAAKEDDTTNGTITTSSKPNNYTSNAMGDVTVGDGATLDLNGRAGLWLRTITLGEGAIYQNSGGTVGTGERQLQGIRLTGNATVRGDNDFGLVAGDWGETTLNLGGYTLTKEGRGKFLISNCTVSNGTLKVTEGSFSGNGISDTACPITISGNVKLERAQAEDAEATACFDFSQANSAKPLTIASGATLTMAGPAVADGIKLGYTVLMGNLVANSDVSPTIASHPIASLTVSADSTVAADLLNCVTGSTTVESDKTLSLSGTGVSLTKLPTGTGSVKIPARSSVTYENGANAYSGKTTVEGDLTLACELGFTQDGSANPTYPIKIAQGGTVTLADGASTYRSFQGEGDIEVTGNATLGIPGAASVEGGFAVAGNVRVNSGATLKVTSWTSNAVLSGANFQVEGQVTQDIYGFSLTVAANKTLSGTGTISVPVELKGTLETSAALTFEKRVTVATSATLNGAATFASGAELWAEYPAQFSGAVTFLAGAVLDVTQSHTPVFAGQLTLPETPLALRADGLFANALITTSGSLDAADFTFAEDSTVTSTTHGIYVKAGIAPVQYLMVVKKPSIPPIAGDDEAKSEASALQEVLIAEFLERTGGLYPLSGVTATGNAKVEGALLFDNVRTLVKYVNENNVPDHYEYEVAYDFGVADMTIKSLQLLPGDNATTMYVLLAAKVQNSADSNTASFAEGTKLTVLNGTKEITPTPVSAAEAGAVAETGVQWLAVPLKTLFPDTAPTGTRPLTVKASKASN